MGAIAFYLVWLWFLWDFSYGGFSLVSACFCGILMNLGLDFDSESCGDFPLVVCCFNEFGVGDTLGHVKFEFWLK